MTESEQLFDPEAFLQGSIETEFDADYTPIEEGDYNGVIQKVDTNSGTSEKGPWAVLNITWMISQEGHEEDGRQARQSLFLDIDENGRLLAGKNKNVRLGKLLEALNLRGRPWSPAQLEGMVASINISNRDGKGAYEGQIFSEVSKVAAAA